MGVFTDHPHTAITEKINNIIQQDDIDIDLELASLIEIIALQYSGAIEAARAIRKKLKYGKLYEKDRSLDLLNALVMNGGKNLQEIYNDRKLLERLRLSAVDPQENIKLRKKIITLAIAWNEQFEGDRYHFGIVNLKGQLPLKVKVKKKPTNHFMDDEAYHSEDESEQTDDSISRNRQSGSGSGSGPVDPNRKYKIPQINLKKEGPKIKLLISEATSASTDLTNALKSLPPNVKSSSDKKSTALFDKTRIIRRKILRYLQLVDSEEFLGSLISSNEVLVQALQLYTEKSGANEDSDDYSDLSDDDDSEYDSTDLESVTDSLASSMIDEHERNRRAPPPVPGSVKVNGNRKTQLELARAGKKIGDDDPFGDDNIVDDSAEWK